MARPSPRIVVLVLSVSLGLVAGWWVLTAAGSDDSALPSSVDTGPPTSEPDPGSAGAESDEQSEPSAAEAEQAPDVGEGSPEVTYAGGGAAVDSLPWAPATIAIADPMDHGAVGDGVTNDGDAIEAAMNALPDEGGIVYFGDGLAFRTTWVIWMEGDHIKLWAPNGQAEILSEGNDERSQAFLCRDLDGCGFFGLRFRSDASKRLDALEDSQIVADGADLVEVVGVEVEGSASAALFFFGESTRAYVEGNYIHHSWSDAIHFTNGSRGALVWDNTIFNGGAEFGDDGIACVSYEDDRLCGEMEWWDNTHLGDGWGRGYSVIGGEQISIHDNFARDIAGAGIVVASESAYGTRGSADIAITDNVLFRTSRKIPHPGILVSGETSMISDVAVIDNVVVESLSGESVRVEGDTSNIDDEGNDTELFNLPDPLPSRDAPVSLRDTSVLKTRDVSFAPEESRRGLYRIHVRRSPDGNGFEQGFEYVVAGDADEIDRWSDEHSAAIVYRTGTSNEEHAVLFSAAPIVLSTGLRAVDGAELRAGDIDGSLSALWLALEPTG